MRIVAILVVVVVLHKWLNAHDAEIFVGAVMLLLASPLIGGGRCTARRGTLGGR